MTMTACWTRKPAQSFANSNCNFYASTYSLFPNGVLLFKQASLALARLSMSPRDTTLLIQALAIRMSA